MYSLRFTIASAATTNYSRHPFRLILNGRQAERAHCREVLLCLSMFIDQGINTHKWLLPPGVPMSIKLFAMERHWRNR
jgi:hypothetical protein